MRTLAFLLVCSLIALMIVQVERNRREESAALTIEQEAAEFFLDQAVTTRYNKNGDVHYQITGEHLEYFKLKDVVEIRRPYFILHSKDGHTWHTRADTATVLPDDAGVRLEGSVRGWQPERHIELTTESLLLIPAREYAETSRVVTIKSVSGVTRGTGMTVDLLAETMQLHADVRGSYLVK